MAAEIIREVIGLDRQVGLDSSGNFVVRSGRVAAAGRAYTVTASAAAGAANVSLVTLTVKDIDGTAVAFPVHMDVTLSDATSGAGLTGTTASGAVAAGASGIDLVTLVTKKALRVQTTAAGVYILSITDTSKTAFKVCAVLDGSLIVVATLAAGNYG